MSQIKPEPEKKGSNTWWIAGAALFLGYYLGQGEKPATPSGTAYAEAPVIIPAEDEAAATAAVDEALEAAAAAVDSAGQAVEDAADESGYAEAESDSSEYQAAYATAPETAYSSQSEEADASVDDAASVAVETAGTATAGPWTRYQSADNSTYQPSTSTSTYRPRSTYVPPAGHYAAPKCESTGCYGVISKTTGLPRTQYVSGYYRKDGTYVRPYYRSKRN